MGSKVSHLLILILKQINPLTDHPKQSYVLSIVETPLASCQFGFEPLLRRMREAESDFND